MSDRAKGFTVVLERDFSQEDFTRIQEALEMIQGVLSVAPVISTPEDFWARQRVRRELQTQLLAVLDDVEARK